MRAVVRAVVTPVLAVVTAAIAPAQDPPAQERRQEPAPVSVPDQYKRVHQQALRHVLAGRFDRAHALLDAADAEGVDVESAFLRTVLAARRGDGPGALAAAREALRRGLPPGRLVAGPRELFAGLRDNAELAALLGSAGPLVHGPMVGAVTATSARVWVRTREPATVRVVVDGGEPNTVGSAASTAAADFTVAVELAGLTPGREQRYEVWIDGRVVARGTFRTAPAVGTPGRFTLAFGGGAGFVPAHERMWDTVRDAGPELLLLLGDNVYIDAPRNDAMQRYTYYRRQSVPAYRQLLAQVPVFAIWDDHDFGTNDCSGGPEIERPPWKRKVWRRFVQNWANPGYGGGEAQPGCWFSFSWGDVDFFLLDGRYYRTEPKATPESARSMLGPVQKAWLKAQVGASRATFKVLCSPVPWDYRTKGESPDTWNGFRAEREELLSFLASEDIDGVVLLSADRHRSDAWRIAREDGYDLFEFNSSRLTNQHVHPTMKAAELSYNDKQSFGLVTFDTTVADPTVTYVVRTIDGEDVGQLEVRSSQLRGR